MRLIKMFGLAVVAAVAAMAFIGASSAMAESTALCEVNELECPEEKRYPIGTEVSAQLLHQTANLHENLLKTGGSTLLNGAGQLEVTCFESNSEGKTSSLLSKDFEGALSSLKFGHCFYKVNLVECTVSIPKLGTLLLLKTGPNLGSGSVSGVLALVTCGTAFKCAYETSALPFHATGSTETENPKLKFTKAKLKVHGIVGEVACPSEGFFDATYEITKPIPGYITL